MTLRRGHDPCSGKPQEALRRSWHDNPPRGDLVPGGDGHCNEDGDGLRRHLPVMLMEVPCL